MNSEGTASPNPTINIKSLKRQKQISPPLLAKSQYIFISQGKVSKGVCVCGGGLYQGEIHDYELTTQGRKHNKIYYNKKEIGRGGR